MDCLDIEDTSQEKLSQFVKKQMTIGDLNGGYASMITYMLFYISMNQGTFACIVSFGLRIETDNI